MRLDAHRPRKATARRAAELSDWLDRNAVLGPESGHDGAVATWREADGGWNAGYPEIAGYFLSFRRWVDGPEPVTRRVGDWLVRIAADCPPPTRIYAGSPADWRNDFLFAFDLAIVIRGLAQTAAPDSARTATEAYVRWLLPMIDGSGAFAPGLRRRPDIAPPDRWSTRRGVHHAKAAAAILSVDVSSRALAEAARETLRSLSPELAAAIRHGGAHHAHPALYGVEGFLIDWGRTGNEASLETARAGFAALLELLHADWPARARASDVVAQLLRAGVVLETAGALEDASWTELASALEARLADCAAPDGGLWFDNRREHRNSWAAMFAAQALDFRVRRSLGDLDARAAARFIV